MQEKNLLSELSRSNRIIIMKASEQLGISPFELVDYLISKDIEAIIESYWQMYVSVSLIFGGADVI